MAQIVVLKESLAKVGVSEVGDLIGVHDDITELSGPGYEEFYVISLPWWTKEQVQTRIDNVLPELIEEDGKTYYDKDGELIDVSELLNTKYFVGFSNITETMVDNINNGVYTSTQVLTWWNNNVVSKVEKAIANL